MDKKVAKMALGRKNFMLLGVSMVIIVIGYLLLAGGKNPDTETFNNEMFSFRRITLAPLVLLFGYLFAIYAIMVKDKSKVQQEEKQAK
ncbi:MAG: DUF3098 domain-containing protein [Luteibaculaceae bacterium]